MEIRNRDETRAFQTIDSSTIREIIHPNNSSVKNQSLAEAIVKPGEKTREHSHPSAEEIYYILQGKGRIFIAGEIKSIHKKDAVLIPPETPHYIENVGNNDLIFLCCCSPPYNDNDVLIL